jgi:hypothetical protein
MTIKELKLRAQSIGACSKINAISTYKAMVELMFSPQGREFCKDHFFPGINALRQVRHKVKDLGVYVDGGTMHITDRAKVVVAGKTNATVRAHGVDEAFIVIVMHGAKVTIDASYYAVVAVVNIGGEVKVKNDSTAIVL